MIIYCRRKILKKPGPTLDLLFEVVLLCVFYQGEDKSNYGKQRLWGSIGWSLFAIISGACVDWYSAGLEYKNYALGYSIALLCFLLDIYVVFKLKVVQENDTKVVASDVKKEFTEVKVLAFLLWIVLIGFFMSFIWIFVFWYMEDLSNKFHPETKSWMKTVQGMALLIKCFGGEVPSFLLSSYVLKRVDHMTIFSVVFFTFTLIFSLYTVIENPLWALPVELLNGMTYAMSYSTAISYAALITPAGAEGTLQGVVGTAYMGTGTYLSHPQQNLILIGTPIMRTIFGLIDSFKEF